MANNFDLRQFLTENKLTKNTQLLKEEINSNVEDIAGAFHEAGLTGMVTVLFQSDSSMGEPDINTMPVERAMKSIIRKAANAESVMIAQGSEIRKGEQIGDYEEETEGLECKVVVEILDKGVYEIYQGSNNVDEATQGTDISGYWVMYGGLNKGIPMFIKMFPSEEEAQQALQNAPTTYGQHVLRGNWGIQSAQDWLASGKEITPDSMGHPDRVPRKRLSPEELKAIRQLDFDAEMEREGVEEGKSYKVSKNSKEAQHLKKGDIIGSGDEVVSVSAGAKTPSGKVEVTLKTKDGKTKTSTMGKTTKVGVKEKETVKENRMTQRDKYLTRLVENALGLQVTEDDNVDYTMGRQDDPDQLPNPAPELNIPEGDEMVNEKPLPKYENIEKLMQEIDKNTDEEAHKFKVQEMKRVADGLEKKSTALEEGDDADHIDQKKLKQMKKDIMTLRKGIEKMEKLGEKKFTKKETKADLKEGFDLRKFLVENKLTTNSKMLNENEIPSTLGIEIGADLEVGMNTEPSQRPAQGGFSFKPASLDGGYKEAYIYIENQPELIKKLTTLYNSQEFDQLNSEIGNLVQQHTGESLESFTNPE